MTAENHHNPVYLKLKHIWRRFRFYMGSVLLLAPVLYSLTIASSHEAWLPPLSGEKLAPPRIVSRKLGHLNLDGKGWFDPARPCLTSRQAQGLGGVLFRDLPRRDPLPWLEALNSALFELKIRCRDETFLLLIVTTIRTESGVRADPPLENRNLESLFEFKLNQLRNDSLLAGAMLDQADLDEALRIKLREDTRRRVVRTEGDLGRYVENNLRAWLGAYLEQSFYLPAPLAKYTVELVLNNPVNTLGPMQVNAEKAYRNALKRGEQVNSVAEMKRWLVDRDTALFRGLKEGISQLWRGYSFYRKRFDPESAVLYTAVDYNAGEFSSRNAAFQERVADLTRHALVIDGDLLVYQGGEATTGASNTEAAVLTLNLGMTPDRIREDLRQEKEAGFITTQTYAKVCERYRKVMKHPCLLAILPKGAANEAGKLKSGRTFTPVHYARAAIKRWETNRALYRKLKPRN